MIQPIKIEDFIPATPTPIGWDSWSYTFKKIQIPLVRQAYPDLIGTTFTSSTTSFITSNTTYYKVTDTGFEYVYDQDGVAC